MASGQPEENGLTGDVTKAYETGFSRYRVSDYLNESQSSYTSNIFRSLLTHSRSIFQQTVIDQAFAVLTEDQHPGDILTKEYFIKRFLHNVSWTFPVTTTDHIHPQHNQPESYFKQVAISLKEYHTWNRHPFSVFIVNRWLYMERMNMTQILSQQLVAGDDPTFIRTKRQISSAVLSGACGLLRISQLPGVGQSRVIQYIQKRIPEPWRNQLKKILETRGLLVLMRVARLFCGSSRTPAIKAAVVRKSSMSHEPRFGPSFVELMQHESVMRSLPENERKFNCMNAYIKDAVASGLSESEAELRITWGKIDMTQYEMNHSSE